MSVSKVAKIKFIDYEKSVCKALDLINVKDSLPQKGKIFLKPNLTNWDPPPVTTNCAAVEAVLRYCKKYSSSKIYIGEGCGSGETFSTYKANGYLELAKKYNIELIDFNKEKSICLKSEDTFNLKEFYLPEILMDAFVISIPVLKDHSFTKTTISLKNMFGIAPEPYYGGSWNKSKLHYPSTDKSVVDVCIFKKPDLSVVDANIALKGSHLSGTPVTIGCILASFDPVAVDAVGSKLLGHNPENLEYLRLADGLLGNLENFKIIEG